MAGDWSQSIQKKVGPQTAGGGRVVLSPSRLTVFEGGELPFQQGRVLLPTGYDLSGLPDNCEDDHDWKDTVYAWNVGVPITVAAPEDDDSVDDKLTIIHDLGTVSAECLGNPADYAPDPVYDGMFGLAIEVTERDND